MNKASLLSIATATPPHSVTQDDAVALAAVMFGEKVFRRAHMDSLFRNTGINRRALARPVEWYGQPHEWPERNAVYLEVADALYQDASNAALRKAGLTAKDLGAVVTVSSTGIATPSLEARVFPQMGFDPAVRRTPVFGLGCGGGVAGLALATRLAEARPGRPVLVTTVELCSLSVRTDAFTKENVVATALFGDGAASAIVVAGGDEGVATIEADGEHLWPETLDIMGWRIDPVGFGVVLSNKLPTFVLQRMGEARDALYASTGMAAADIDRFVCHPGGAKVLPALESVFGLAEGSLDIEREVLADYGNMSAPTVLFVLERVLAAGVKGRLAMTALGPGFTAGHVVMKTVA